MFQEEETRVQGADLASKRQIRVQSYVWGGFLLDEQTKLTEEPPQNMLTQIINSEPNFEVED